MVAVSVFLRKELLDSIEKLETKEMNRSAVIRRLLYEALKKPEHAGR